VLATLAVVTSLLAIDDLFMLHETFLTGSLLASAMTPVLYGLVLGTVGIVFRSILLVTAGALPILALGFLGLSAFIDFVHDEHIVWISDASARHLLEDGTKFLGIVTWLLFALVIAGRITGSVLDEMRSLPRQAR
jgi:hypothetical protein